MAFAAFRAASRPTFLSLSRGATVARLPAAVVSQRRSAHLPASHAAEDDGLGVGDYPKIPYSHAQLRDPRKYVFDPQERRELEDTLDENDEILSVWAPDAKHPVSDGTAVLHLSIALGSIGLFLYMIYLSDPESRRPTAVRTLPPPKPEHH
eukprot:Opistho-2@51992